MITITRAELLDIYRLISMMESAIGASKVSFTDILGDFELLDRVEKTLREKLTKED